MSKQVDPKKSTDNKAKPTDNKAAAKQPVQAKPAQSNPAPKNAPNDNKSAKQPEAKPLPATNKQVAVVPQKQVAPVSQKQAPQAALANTTAAAKTAGPQKSALHSDIDKIVVDATTNYEHKKTTKTEIVHDVKEIKIIGDDKKSYTALVVYLPFVYVQNHRALLAKIVNDIQSKKKLPTFVISQRTLLNKKSAQKQRIPRNRTLTSVYDSILEDLIAPGVVIGKRLRYHLDGSQHIKVFLNEDSRAFLENKTPLIAQIYKQLTNRKVTFEFRPDTSYIRVPLIKAPRAKGPKRGTTAPRREAAAPVAAQ